MPGITLGDTVPNLEEPRGDFTPVCTTELGAMGKYAHEFEQRGVKLLAVSDEEAKKLFPQGFKTAELPSKKGYLRVADVS
ncbi:hypothetical protein Bca52824_038965 [Brassica carinata]|uniref:Alkyl hydroperoxide reductase subunit C/ Thiol specific antioxidant domain-containing protein n=1 Tax=Brassica carinata TaxID=52824 RepID=A0A8X7UXP6_BRACI|nr:hypothetical protein Bca52824_038965 [Brassica carinata]